MSWSKWIVLATMFLTLFAHEGLAAQADSNVGRFGWLLAPSCEVVVLQVEENGGVFALHGFVDLTGCGEGRQVPADGAAVPRADGNFGVWVTIIFPGNAVHVHATLNPGTVSGPWVDNLGNTGTLTFLGPR